MGHYAYGMTQHDLYVNLFVGGAVRVPFKSGDVILRVETNYPWEGQVTLRPEAGSPRSFALRVRKPGWCNRAAWKLNGEEVHVAADDWGYWVVRPCFGEGVALFRSVQVNHPFGQLACVRHPTNERSQS